MKMSSLKMPEGAGLALAILAGGAVLYFFARQARAAVGEAATAINNVNQGTPYQGFGVVGTLGNATNQVSGNILEEIGSKIGLTLYDWLNDD